MHPMMQICRYVFIVMLIVLIGEIVLLCTGGGAGEAVEFVSGSVAILGSLKQYVNFVRNI
jgi:hypothetical protein